MSVHTLLFAVFVVIAFYRYTRWFAVVQQKEYRLDRLLSFFKTTDGLQELLKFFPKKHELHRASFKRPKLTGRVIILAVLVMMMHAVLFLLLERSNAPLLFFLFSIIVAPGVILLANVPVSITVKIIEKIILTLASRKVLSHSPQIIGITGSYGKTTTKQLLAWLLADQFSVWSTSGSVNTPLGIALSVLKSYQGEEIIVLEYGAYKKGEIKKLVSFFPPAQVVLTALNEQHAALFGSIEGTAKAKAELLFQFPESGAVFVFDTSAKKILAAAEKMYDQKFQTQYLTDSQLRVTHDLLPLYDQTVQGVAQVVESLFSLSQKQIQKRILAFVPTERWIRLTKKAGITIIDDGITSNPTGFFAALDILDTTEKEYAILITNGIVDLGAESETIHSQIARIAAKVVDEVWCSSAEFSQYFSKQKCQVISDELDMLGKVRHLKKGTAILIEGAIASSVRKKLYEL